MGGELAGIFPLRSRRKTAFSRIIILSILAVFVAGALAGWQLVKSVPPPVLPGPQGPLSGVRILDRYDHLICLSAGEENRVPVKLNDVSQNMVKAILAAEDHRFFEHHGLDPLGTLRAAWNDIQAGHPLEGASTITQQLAKNLYFRDEGRTIKRKLKEVVAAWNIEATYSKERILEAYLNEVYFGNGAYGIERAAQVYFGKEPASLTLSESAFLAGLVKAPSELSLPSRRQEALARQREIVRNMVSFGFIGRKEADKALSQPVHVRGNTAAISYPYYVSYVLELLKGYGQDFWNNALKNGLSVYTNLDPQAQAAAERILAERTRKAPRGVSQSALVSLSVDDGSVRALVGGVGEYRRHQWNRAIHGHTAGSSFKPFVYLTALNDRTLVQDSLIDDLPITFQQHGAADYTPKDFDGRYLGPISVRKALALSRNICAVRVAYATGIENVIATAHAAGIKSKLDNNLSLSLGSDAVTPLEMAAAYSTLARGGVAIEPRVIRRIENAHGQVIADFPPEPRRVFQQEPVAELVDAMRDVVERGTGTMARLPGRPVAGKTGTADQAKDIWFIGFTPDLVTAVWGGNDANNPIAGNHVTGGSVMAGFWHDYMMAYYSSHPIIAGAFPQPLSPLMDEPDFSDTPAPYTVDIAHDDFGQAWHDIKNALLPDTKANRHSDSAAVPDNKRKTGVFKRLIRTIFNWL